MLSSLVETHDNVHGSVHGWVSSLSSRHHLLAVSVNPSSGDPWGKPRRHCGALDLFLAHSSHAAVVRVCWRSDLRCSPACVCMARTISRRARARATYDVSSWDCV
jgi:hypothetical protein